MITDDQIYIGPVASTTVQKLNYTKPPLELDIQNPFLWSGRQNSQFRTQSQLYVSPCSLAAILPCSLASFILLFRARDHACTFKRLSGSDSFAHVDRARRCMRRQFAARHQHLGDVLASKRVRAMIGYRDNDLHHLISCLADFVWGGVSNATRAQKVLDGFLLGLDDLGRTDGTCLPFVVLRRRGRSQVEAVILSHFREVCRGRGTVRVGSKKGTGGPSDLHILLGEQGAIST
ncbi:hypothetical protein BZA70DRAFT_270583 [Myxozyma melibiosi]|uniref:Uncharacterized protein n=1 Tax=Myxozyma melibiosi TaxID=54550 RepID=A0ABR1FBB5_9ASCO